MGTVAIMEYTYWTDEGPGMTAEPYPGVCDVHVYVHVRPSSLEYLQFMFVLQLWVA